VARHYSWSSHDAAITEWAPRCPYQNMGQISGNPHGGQQLTTRYASGEGRRGGPSAHQVPSVTLTLASGLPTSGGGDFNLPDSFFQAPGYRTDTATVAFPPPGRRLPITLTRASASRTMEPRVEVSPATVTFVWQVGTAVLTTFISHRRRYSCSLVAFTISFSKRTQLPYYDACYLGSDPHLSAHIYHCVETEDTTPPLSKSSQKWGGV